MAVAQNPQQMMYTNGGMMGMPYQQGMLKPSSAYLVCSGVDNS